MNDYKLNWVCIKPVASDYKKIPNKSGVYIIKDSETVFYIGASLNLQQRIRTQETIGYLLLNHLVRGDLCVWYALVDEHNYKYVEKNLIRLLQPIKNTQSADSFILIDIVAYELMLDKLRDVIKLKGRKLKWISEKIGVSESFFNMKIHKHYPFTDSEINKINELLGTNFKIERTKVVLDFGITFI